MAFSWLTGNGEASSISSSHSVLGARLPIAILFFVFDRVKDHGSMITATLAAISTAKLISRVGGNNFTLNEVRIYPLNTDEL